MAEDYDRLVPRVSSDCAAGDFGPEGFSWWIRQQGAVSEKRVLVKQDDNGRAEEILDDLEIPF